MTEVLAIGTPLKLLVAGAGWMGRAMMTSGWLVPADSKEKQHDSRCGTDASHSPRLASTNRCELP